MKCPVQERGWGLGLENNLGQKSLLGFSSPTSPSAVPAVKPLGASAASFQWHCWDQGWLSWDARLLSSKPCLERHLASRILPLAAVFPLFFTFLSLASC